AMTGAIAFTPYDIKIGPAVGPMPGASRSILMSYGVNAIAPVIATLNVACADANGVVDAKVTMLPLGNEMYGFVVETLAVAAVSVVKPMFAMVTVNIPV